MTDLRYPIGPFVAPERYAPHLRAAFINDIEATPSRMRAAVEGLSSGQVRHPYRDGGWTVAQVVHHVADSHLNSYVRFKLAATEDNPPVKAYDEKLWAELPDAVTTDLTASLDLLASLHARWVIFLRGLRADDFARTFQHSALGAVSLDRALALYAWHGRHHTAHITGLRDRQGW